MFGSERSGLEIGIKRSKMNPRESLVPGIRLTVTSEFPNHCGGSPVCLRTVPYEKTLQRYFPNAPYRWRHITLSLSLSLSHTHTHTHTHMAGAQWKASVLLLHHLELKVSNNRVPWWCSGQVKGRTVITAVLGSLLWHGFNLWLGNFCMSQT